MTTDMEAELDEMIQVSECGKTVWIFSKDGSTIGRFSKMFGMDIHTTVTEQMAGARQCLHCTHVKPGPSDWLEFCRLVQVHFDVTVDPSILTF